MSESTSLRDQFLISMPHLDDRHFSRSLTYICDHSEYGAMGIIINRPAGMLVHDLFAHIELDYSRIAIDPMPVFKGGPIHPDRGFVLHRDDGRRWLSSHTISQEIRLTTSMDILEAMALGKGPKDCLVALGYAGWSPGQLEQEICDNTWLSCPANSDIMFRLPAEERLQAAAASLGVNLQLMTAHAGHA
ncbi:MAG: YqgE/AlgH family protein [Nitrincola lacisaponensis]|uniref:YqgE/AlgH family protein n=1 Tax=Nitrincola lacisaponensis TaxID=267850 RepID=UPI0039198B93